MVDLPGGSFRMGSTRFYPEEAPIHTVTVRAFAVERHPVTNAQFAEFVSATGYVTVAEQPLDPGLYPGVDAADLCPGAMVFCPTAGPVDLRDWRQWWDWVPGACWRHPFGRDSDIADRAGHPVRTGGLSGRRGLRTMGWSTPTDRGRVGVRGPWRNHGNLCVGRPGEAGGHAHGEHLAGPVSLPQRRCIGLGGNLPGGQVSGQRVWLARHDRKRLGVDHHRVLSTPSHRSTLDGLLRTGQARYSRRPDDQPDPQGRLAPVRAGVLPPLPPGGALAAVAGHRDHPYRVPVRGRPGVRVVPTSHEELHTQQGVSRRDESLPGATHEFDYRSGPGWAWARAVVRPQRRVAVQTHALAGPVAPKSQAPQTSCSPAMTPVATI
ncbi:hypothetical protein MRGA423_04435 [Mycobacterium tuberculosis RGTB423]|nr:hypothetical protein MRGA423_04435 [Mycobacterium tuberculosis RGTB423]